MKTFRRLYNLKCSFKLVNFYRAIVRTLLSQDVRLSVGLSVTRRYYVETTKHILKLFSPSDSHNVLVFFIHSGTAVFRRGIECKVV